MNVTVTYETQLKRATGATAETVDVPHGSSIVDVIQAVVQRHDDQVSGMLLGSDGNVRPSILIFLGEEQISPDATRKLTDGDTVTLMSPISGG